MLAGESAVLEDLQQVAELAMNIAAYLDGGLELEEHGLRDEYLSAFETDRADLGFTEDGFFLVVFVKAVDDFVKVELLVLKHGCVGLL